MIVAFVSGSSQSGQTTMAVSLASILKDHFPVTILDCDIEQINAAVLQPPKWDIEEEVKISAPMINRADCTYCLNCVNNCRFGVFLDFKKSIVILPERCANCGTCFSFCTGHAISLTSYVLGTIRKGTLEKLTVVEARINELAVKADLLLYKARSHVDPLGVNIVDCAPHFSDYAPCSTLTPNFFVIVTEETSQSLKELVPMAEALNIIKKPFGVLINKSRSINSPVEQYCKKQGLLLLGVLPYEDTVNNGKLPSHQFVLHSPWKFFFEKLWDRILEELTQ